MTVDACLKNQQVKTFLAATPAGCMASVHPEAMQNRKDI
jgi:hypothetical protein